MILLICAGLFIVVVCSLMTRMAYLDSVRYCSNGWKVACFISRTFAIVFAAIGVSGFLVLILNYTFGG